MSAPENSFLAENRDQWREWLSQRHNTEKGVWLIRYKKNSGKPSLSYDDAVEEAICFGWVDSLPRKLDDFRSMLYFAPRKKGSGWSRLNKQRVEAMYAAGKMTPAGLAKVDTAKADGSWIALDAVENLEIPDDLAEAFAAYEQAEKYFNAFPRSVKRGILEWISNAKKAETRGRRISETARLADKNERANQWRKK